MILPETDQAAQYIRAPEDRAVRGCCAANRDVIPAPGATMPPVEHEFLGAQPGVMRLFIKGIGIADQLFPGKEKTKSVYSFMQDAHAAGVKFFACGGGMEEHDLGIGKTIPEFDGARGAAAYIDAIIQDGVVAITY